MKLLISKLLLFFKLIRYPNLLIMAATMYLMQYALLKPMIEAAKYEMQMSSLSLFLIVFATVCIAAAGYIINDVHDVEIDTHNKSDKVIIGKHFSESTATIWYYVLNVMGILAGVWVSRSLGLNSLSLIYILTAGLLYFYSSTYKDQLLIGNLIIALLTGVVPMLPFLYEIPLLNRAYETDIVNYNASFNDLMQWAWAYAIFAFLLNLIREFVKDTEDFEGDKAYGRTSIPIAAGSKITKWIISSITILFICLVTLGFKMYLLLGEKPIADFILAIYLGVLIISPLLFAIYKTITAQNTSDYRIISQTLKLVMAGGLLFTIVLNIVLNLYYRQ